MDPSVPIAPVVEAAAKAVAQAAPVIPAVAPIVTLALLVLLAGFSCGGLALFLRIFPFWPPDWRKRKPLSCPLCLAFWCSGVSTLAWHALLTGGDLPRTPDFPLLAVLSLGAFAIGAFVVTNVHPDASELLPPPGPAA